LLVELFLISIKINTMRDTLLVNEVEKGLWIVFWELRETPELSQQQLVKETDLFSCAGNNTKILFRLDPINLKVTLQVILKGKLSQICCRRIILKPCVLVQVS
jgi:hypothetical protein